MRPLLRIVALLAAALFLAACEQDIVINADFSVNIFHPGPKWPKVKKLKPAEREVYERYGKPDGFKVYWDSTGKLRTRIDAQKEFEEKQKAKQLPNYSWVYLGKGIEVKFNGNTPQEVPITDETRIIFKYGDPEDVKQLYSGVTQWMFYGAGKLYKFAPNGRVVEEKDFPAMGKFQKL